MTIVVGFVPTKEGRAALARAAQEARDKGSRLIVINSDRSGHEDHGEDAEQDLDRVAEELRASGNEVEVRRLVRGNEPAEDLLAAAAESDAELIVIGLRRRTPVGKLILGSNAQRILLDAPCAVLAVKS